MRDMNTIKVPGFITVRSASSRLPKKCLLPFGDDNVLEHIIHRSQYYGLEPIVCTTFDQLDDVIQVIAEKENIRFFRGNPINKLKRWLDCCDYFDIEKFHTIDADDPFFDGEQIKESYRLLNKGYDMVCPTESSSAGSASVGYSLTRDIVASACDLISENEDTEMMWYYIYKVKGLKKINLPENEQNSLKVRLTLDYEEDYWLLQTVRRILGNLALRKDINELFRRNPDLHKINWFRNEEWRQKQLDKRV
ncbi:MAG: cytidylyltransferase domain-containing protein [bacterium]